MASLDTSALRGSHPIVLLPVRLETRFDTAAATLRVRIYPDEIFADTHEPELTDSELAAGKAYWNTLWKKTVTPEDELAAWQGILRQYPAPRAAWIVEALTPTNPADRGDLPINLPTPPRREQSWTRPALADLLPDRWLVVAYRGSVEVLRGVSREVQRPLTLTFSPRADVRRVKLSGDLALDEDLLWTIDYGAALDAGMAVDLAPLGPDDLSNGFDRVLALGLISAAPDATTKRLEALLDTHHYTRGLSFVRQGTPTNNTSAAPAGFPPSDPGGARSLAVERGKPSLSPGCDGLRFAGALGLRPEVIEHITDAERDELGPSRAMADALWPATLGYFAQQMMHPVFSDANVDDAASGQEQKRIAEARRYFVDHVHPRGPSPAFRVGSVPYGVLPVTSLDRFVLSLDAGAFEQELASMVKFLRPRWVAGAAGVPKIGAGTDADDVLLRVLGMDASAQEVRVRKAVGPGFIVNLFKDLGILAAFILAAWQGRQDLIKTNLANVVGKDWKGARLASTNLFDPAARFGPPLVAPAPLSEEQAAPGYVGAIANYGIDALRLLDPGGDAPLLQRVLRHAALSEYARILYDLLIISWHRQYVPVDWDERYERELVGMPGTLARPTIWERFDTEVRPPGLTKDVALKEYLFSPDGDKATGGAVSAYRRSLDALVKVPAAELERLFTESLDVCSHRLDAWISSFADKRLEEIRAMQAAGTLEPGSHLGAFGWVEDLRPAKGSASSGGHIHAPSLVHAATAAVLRSAHLTHDDEDKQRYAVNLSSNRARTAREILDAVRNGQALGAILGYRFERGLRDRKLQAYVAPVRKLFPLVADKGGSSGAPVEAIAARNVADGLRLRGAFREGTLYGKLDLPGSAGAVPGFDAELARLDEAIDAVTDLLGAESVFQLARGNLLAATATLDALAQGNRPTDPNILHTTRSGLSITHRVGVILGGGAAALGTEWGNATQRALAEPLLDAWVGALIGDPRRVLARVSVSDPVDGDPHRRKEIKVSLDALGLRPLDVLALGARGGTAAEGAELDRRVAAAALHAPAKDIQIIYARDPSWKRDEVQTFPDVMELCRALDALFTGARPLRPEDLRRAEASPGGTLDVTEIATRANVAVGAAKAARDKLTKVLQGAPGAPTVRDALTGAAAFGVPCFPPLHAALDELAAAESARSELDRRLAAARDPDPLPTDPAGLVKLARGKLEALFSGGFVALPQFTPADKDELTKALAKGPTTGADPVPIAVSRWMAQVSRVRPSLGRWRTLQLYVEALGRGRSGYDLLQVPFDAADPWVALARPVAALEGKVSLVLHRHAKPDPGSAWTGLLLDEWTEVVPYAEQPTGVAFHFDSPGAEAPQAILVAVPPDPNAASWDEATLLAILGETLDLARIRAVDTELLGDFAQLLPAIHLADDARVGNTVATTFDGALRAEPTITGP